MLTGPPTLASISYLDEGLASLTSLCCIIQPQGLEKYRTKQGSGWLMLDAAHNHHGKHLTKLIETRTKTVYKDMFSISPTLLITGSGDKRDFYVNEYLSFVS